MRIKAMKHNHYSERACGAGRIVVPIRFEFTRPRAVSICIAGTFDEWTPEAQALHPTGGRSLGEGKAIEDRLTRKLLRGVQPVEARAAGRRNDA
jgi:hypothetical protein